MRGLAACVVLVYHLGLVCGIRVAPFGYLAVDFFFMLSGFVIALSYEDRLRSGALSPGGFARRRVVRLYPMLFLGAALGAIVHLALRSPERAAPTAWLIFLLLPAFGPGELFPFNGPFWSLLFEAVANAAHVLALRRLTQPVLVAVIAAGAAGIALLVVRWHWLNLGWSGTDWFAALPRVAFGYGTGVLICRLRLSGRLPERALPGWMAPLPILALLLPFAAHGRPLILLFEYLLFPGALVAGLSGGLLGRLEAGVRALGALSFPLYTIHYPVILFCFHRGVIGPAAPVATIALGGGLIALAALLGRAYDPAGQRLLDRLLPARPPLRRQKAPS